MAVIKARIPQIPEIPKKPGFSRSYARKRGRNGVTEAVVMRFLSYHVTEATCARRNRKEGKHWYFNSLKKLSKKLPYFPRSTLADTLDRLEEDGQIIRGRFNKAWKLDKTTWYTVPEEIRDEVEKDIIYFNREVAKRLRDVTAGVLYENLRYRTKIDPDFWYNMSPAALGRVLPVSEATVRRKLAKLVKEGLIIKDPFPTAYYLIAQPQTESVVRRTLLPKFEETDDEIAESFNAMAGDQYGQSTSDMAPSSSEIDLSDSDDNTPYKPL